MLSTDTILIIDDDPDYATLFRRALSVAGIKNPVLAVGNGDEAIRYLSGEGIYHDRLLYPVPGLIVTDLKMPGVDGFELLEWLETQPQYRNLHAIALTGMEETAAIRRANQLGAAATCVKPSSLYELQTLVDATIKPWLPAA